MVAAVEGNAPDGVLLGLLQDQVVNLHPILEAALAADAAAIAGDQLELPNLDDVTPIGRVQ